MMKGHDFMLLAGILAAQQGGVDEHARRVIGIAIASSYVDAYRDFDLASFIREARLGPLKQ